jgi:hypothetical protein
MNPFPESYQYGLLIERIIETTKRFKIVGLHDTFNISVPEDTTVVWPHSRNG